MNAFISPIVGGLNTIAQDIEIIVHIINFNSPIIDLAANSHGICGPSREGLGIESSIAVIIFHQIFHSLMGEVDSCRYHFRLSTSSNPCCKRNDNNRNKDTRHNYQDDNLDKCETFFIHLCFVIHIPCLREAAPAKAGEIGNQ